MSSPKLIIKSGYIKSSTHLLNTLEYAGNKIAAQAVVFSDGSKQTVAPEDIIRLSAAEQSEVSGIEIRFKDSKNSFTISYSKYRSFVDETKRTVRVDELVSVLDEQVFVNAEGKQYHQMKDLEFFKYLSYIEDRPGAEKIHGHGLFGLTGDVDIDTAKQLALEHERSIKWSHIISMPESDSLRLGYDTREAWANLINAKAPQLAKAYNISLENLVINAAYHSNTDNDHCHLLFYSKDPREGFIRGGVEGLNAASEKLKSMFTNEIYRDELAVVKERKNDAEQKLEHRTRQLMEAMQRESYAPPLAVTEQLLELSDAMVPLKGKRQYGYLPAGLKEQVNTILKTLVTDDKYLHMFYDEYMAINREFVSSYNADPKKIDARMKLIEEKFFSPDKNNRGSTQLQNIIVKYAAALAEASPGAGAASSEEKKPAYAGVPENASDIFEGNPYDSVALNDGLPAPDHADDYFPHEPSAAGGRGGTHGAVRAASSEEKKAGYRGPAANASKNEENPMSKLSKQLYAAMTDEIKASADGPLTAIHEALAENNSKDYVYAPFEAKQQINNYIADFLNQDDIQDNYYAELAKRVDKVSSFKQFKSMPLDQLTVLLQERFVKPDEYTSKQLHNQVLQFAQRIDQHRFVEDNRSRFFFSLKKEAFADNPDAAYDDLFLKLRSSSYSSFYKFSDEIKDDVNSIVHRLLTKNNLPAEMIQRFVPPDDLTPLDFQNTIIRFVRVLDRQREVHKLSGEFFKVLRDQCADKETSKEYVPFHKRLKPLEAKGYHELSEGMQADINSIVGNVLSITGADQETIDYFSHPSEDTPTGLHSIVYFYLKRLDLQQLCDAVHADFSSSLQQLAFKENTELIPLFEKLQLVEGAHYQELPEELRKQISLIVGQLLKECEVDEETTNQFIAPDAFTPLTLHEQVFRTVKRLDQHRFVHEISDKFYSSLHEMAFDDQNNRAFNKLHEQLRGNEAHYNELTARQRQTINQIVAGLLKANGVDKDRIRQLTEPDELTPLNLQHTVFRFILHLPEHRFVHDFSSSFFTALREGAFTEGALKDKLQELNRQLARLKDPDIPLKELPAETQALINDAVTEIFRQQNVPQEVLDWFVPSGDGRLPAFHNMVRGFARYYHDHHFVQARRMDFYKALSDSTLPKNLSSGVFSQLAGIRDRLAAYPGDMRYNDMDDPLKADITRLAYAILQQSPADPNGINGQAVIARKLLLAKDAPKDFQNTIIHVARNLNEISQKTIEFDKKRRMHAVLNAVMMCRELAATLNQMSEQDAASHKNYRGEQSKLDKHRTFHRRKVKKHENYVEY